MQIRIYGQIYNFFYPIMTPKDSGKGWLQAVKHDGMIQGGSIGYEQGVITGKRMSTLGVMEEGLVFVAFAH